MPVIEVSGLRKQYGSTVAAEDVSFTVEAGGIFGILRPNGAGKTTTVECVTGLRTPDRGKVRVLGRDPQRDHDELGELVGVQLQDSQLPDKIRVWEALDLYASYYRRPARADELLTRLGLADRRNAFFANLSGGQKQRLSVALALIGNSEVAVLDELTTGLHPNARREVWDLIAEIRSAGVTILLVTQFMEEAEPGSPRSSLLAVPILPYTLAQHPTGGDVGRTLAVVAATVAWLTWFVVLLPPRAGRELQMSVYFVGFLAASAALIARSPWFSFFCWIRFMHALRYLTGGWRYAGVIAAAVLLSIGQTGGFHPLTAPLIAVYVAITLLNAAVVISFSYLGQEATEQSTQRQQMNVDLVAKHAAAARVGITLSYMADVVTLDVRDDGAGFRPPDPEGTDHDDGDRDGGRSGGFGLTAMRQRVQRVAGTLAVESELGMSTAMSASVPAIQRADEGRRQKESGDE
jgi:ABC-type Na+ transport system ATPase subunit NatA